MKSDGGRKQEHTKHRQETHRQNGAEEREQMPALQAKIAEADNRITAKLWSAQLPTILMLLSFECSPESYTIPSTT